MLTERLSIDTSQRVVTDVSDRVRAFASRAPADGLVHVFVPHATAGVALVETGSGTEADLEEAIGRLLPREAEYAHAHGSIGHGGDHVLPAFIGPSLSVPVIDGLIALGTWQSVVVVDPNRDNRERQVVLSFLAG